MPIKLVSAHVFKYKSIDNSTLVLIAPEVTVLVGKNESGKTAFLEALYKCLNLNGAVFDELYDYPRKDRFNYLKKHNAAEYADVARLEYSIHEDLCTRINEELFGNVEVVKPNWKVSRTSHYGPGSICDIALDTVAALKAIEGTLPGTKTVRELFENAPTLSEVLKRIESGNLTGHSDLAEFFTSWHEREEKKAKSTWTNVISHHIWVEYIHPELPRFLYFDDYRLLPGKINLESLKQRMDAKTVNDSDQTIMGLLDLAGVTIDELNSESGYESSKAKLEAISLSISNQVFQFWKQNQDISVEFDVKTDSTESAPFNSGKNLYIRVKNARHGVSVSFDQRSKGFIWFFSFLVWFSSIEARAKTEKTVILLLDEPGLNLHALAQNDFLNFIESLSVDRQIIYTTHSPFMVKNDQLDRVRVVEDRLKEGTTVTSELGGSSDESLFPLQAALGYSIAQNLFISKKNILLEGPADLILLTHMSAILEANQKTGLCNGTLVPVGGLDKLATFIALLGATKLDLVVLHDKAGTANQSLDNMIEQKLIEKKRVLDYSLFRVPTNLETDVEDLFPAATYIEAFNTCYEKSLDGKKVVESELSKHSRIVERINGWLKKNSIQLKSGGGFNHYLVAQRLVLKLQAKTLKAGDLEPFEKLFVKINELLGA